MAYQYSYHKGNINRATAKIGAYTSLIRPVADTWNLKEHHVNILLNRV